MSLRKQITLSWAGKEYSLLVTMEVIDRLEDQINLATMLARSARGDVRFSHAAKLIAALLRECGCQVTAEDVYSEMFGGGDVNPQSVGKMLAAIFAVIFPEPKKKDQEPANPSKKVTSSRGGKRTK